MSHNSGEINSHESWYQLIEALNTAVLVVDNDGIVLYANKNAYTLFNRSEGELIGQVFSYPIESKNPVEIQLFNAKKTITHAQMRVASGSWLDKEAWIITLHDITYLKNYENYLSIYENIFKKAKECIFITDLKGNLIDVNNEFEVVTGYSKDEVVGRNVTILKSDRHDEEYFKQLWSDIEINGFWHGEIWDKKKNNRVFPAMMTISLVQDKNSQPINYVAIFFDISEQVRQQKKLKSMAHFDSLTGLPNRTLLSDRLQHAMAQTTRGKQQLAVIFLDIDHFKNINDSFGHDLGDKVLAKLASRCQETLREEDTISRIGGDEFVILLMNSNLEQSNSIINRLFDVIRKPIEVEEQIFNLTTSMGITLYPQKIEVSDGQLLRQADQAMYQAKLQGRDRYIFFDPEIESKLAIQHQYINEIRDGLKKNQFEIYFQPQVNMKNGKVTGAEALLRWNHPKKGLLLPAKFLPLIASDAFSIELGEWVIEESLRQIQVWKKHKLSISISVNVSSLQLEQSHFLKYLERLVKKYSTSTMSYLRFEILESSALKNMPLIKKIIMQSKKLGVIFMLDDFGAGYTSLNYLKKLPVKYMKIDHSFIANILDNPRDLRILKALLLIANSVDVIPLAEGVESQKHQELLLNLGCELGQGFYIAKPMPVSKFEKWYFSREKSLF